jgi:hypothetical protein
MSRTLCLVFLAAVVVGGLEPARGQSKPAPVYTLPVDGTWVDYEWTMSVPTKGMQKGTLRISSVGHKEINGIKHRWVEITLTYGNDQQLVHRYRKVLVAEAVLQKGRPIQEAVSEAYRQEGKTGTVTLLPRSRWHDLLGMGFGAPDSVLQEVEPAVATQTKLGKVTARHVHAPGINDGRSLDYHGWLTQEVPFGWAKFEIREVSGGITQTIFTAAAVKTGQGAKSEVDETRAASKQSSSQQ